MADTYIQQQDLLFVEQRRTSELLALDYQDCRNCFAILLIPLYGDIHQNIIIKGEEFI